MTDTEIEKQWQKFRKDYNFKDIQSIGARIAINKSHGRTIGWVMNYVNKKPPVEEISDEAYGKLKNIIYN